MSAAVDGVREARDGAEAAEGLRRRGRRRRRGAESAATLLLIVQPMKRVSGRIATAYEAISHAEHTMSSLERVHQLPLLRFPTARGLRRSRDGLRNVGPRCIV